jgi:hypothetical protein
MHAWVSRIDEGQNFVLSSDKAVSAAENTVSGVINAMHSVGRRTASLRVILSFTESSPTRPIRYWPLSITGAPFVLRSGPF